MAAAAATTAAAKHAVAHGTSVEELSARVERLEAACERAFHALTLSCDTNFAATHAWIQAASPRTHASTKPGSNGEHSAAYSVQDERAAAQVLHELAELRRLVHASHMLQLAQASALVHTCQEPSACPPTDFAHASSVEVLDAPLPSGCARGTQETCMIAALAVPSEERLVADWQRAAAATTAAVADLQALTQSMVPRPPATRVDGPLTDGCANSDFSSVAGTPRITPRSTPPPALLTSMRSAQGTAKGRPLPLALPPVTPMSASPLLASPLNSALPSPLVARSTFGSSRVVPSPLRRTLPSTHGAHESSTTLGWQPSACGCSDAEAGRVCMHMRTAAEHAAIATLPLTPPELAAPPRRGVQFTPNHERTAHSTRSDSEEGDEQDEGDDAARQTRVDHAADATHDVATRLTSIEALLADHERRLQHLEAEAWARDKSVCVKPSARTQLTLEEGAGDVAQVTSFAAADAAADAVAATAATTAPTAAAAIVASSVTTCASAALEPPSGGECKPHARSERVSLTASAAPASQDTVAAMQLQLQSLMQEVARLRDSAAAAATQSVGSGRVGNGVTSPTRASLTMPPGVGMLALSPDALQAMQIHAAGTRASMAMARASVHSNMSAVAVNGLVPNMLSAARPGMPSVSAVSPAYLATQAAGGGGGLQLNGGATVSATTAATAMLSPGNRASLALARGRPMSITRGDAYALAHAGAGVGSVTSPLPPRSASVAARPHDASLGAMPSPASVAAHAGRAHSVEPDLRFGAHRGQVPSVRVHGSVQPAPSKRSLLDRLTGRNAAGGGASIPAAVAEEEFMDEMGSAGRISSRSSGTSNGRRSFVVQGGDGEQDAARRKHKLLAMQFASTRQATTNVTPLQTRSRQGRRSTSVPGGGVDDGPYVV